MSATPHAWSWHIHEHHWIDLSLTDVGLAYRGTDLEGPSGGGYMAGFQTYLEFAADGPLNAMPQEIEAAVRAVVEARGGPHRYRVVVRIAGEPPDQIHMSFAGQSQIKSGTDVVFDGDLAAGTYNARGVLLYPGADAKGRRRMKTFDETIVIEGATVIEIASLRPRFAD